MDGKMKEHSRKGRGKEPRQTGEGIGGRGKSRRKGREEGKGMGDGGCSLRQDLYNYGHSTECIDMNSFTCLLGGTGP